tara:strand:+ start:4291 stop:5442 length:1152 start_codon:yes stop_codon:yes gene_type:complete
MKILFVCQQYIHSARWINQLKDAGHDIYVFDCLDRPIHKDLLWTNYTTGWTQRKLPKFKGEHFLKKRIPKLYNILKSYLEVTASERLNQLIHEIQPDLVHSLEMQSQTYHVQKVREQIDFKWAYFSWGSDLYFYQHKEKHVIKMKEVFKNLDYFFADNTRDLKLAKSLGFQKEVVNIFPGGGGYCLEDYQKYIQPVSERKLILIKGYHHWAGRALQVLNALELIIDEIKEYEIYVYSAHDSVVKKIEKLLKNQQLNIKYSTRKKEISHKELLQKFGAAQISIGNSVSDGIPNTLLESIILGAFPIQSNPGGATEDYIENNINGFLIEDPENPKEIASKIMIALKNEVLLNSAFEINKNIAQKIAYFKVQKSVLEVYQNIENTL